MKQKILLVAIVFGITIPASAQFRWGVDAGVNLTKVSFNKEIFSSNNCTGFFVGPKMHVKIPVLGLGIDASARYSYRPITITAEAAPGETIERTKSLHYIEVPLNIRWDFDLKIIGLYITTGPQWDWNIGDLKWEKTETINDVKANLTTNLERNTFFWNVGGGIEFFQHLAIGFNYNIPLGTQGESKISINDIPKTVQTYKNGTWQVYLNYYF